MKNAMNLYRAVSVARSLTRASMHSPAEAALACAGRFGVDVAELERLVAEAETGCAEARERVASGTFAEPLDTRPTLAEVGIDAIEPAKRIMPADCLRRALAITGSDDREIVRKKFFAMYPGPPQSAQRAFYRVWAARPAPDAPEC